MLATGSVKINLVANLIVFISAYIYRNIENEPLKRLFFDSSVCTASIIREKLIFYVMTLLQII